MLYGEYFFMGDLGLSFLDFAYRMKIIGDIVHSRKLSFEDFDDLQYWGFDGWLGGGGSWVLSL